MANGEEVDVELTGEEMAELLRKERQVEQQKQVTPQAKGKAPQAKPMPRPGQAEELPDYLYDYLERIGVNSVEAQLWRLINPQFEDILQGKDWKAKPIRQSRKVLELRWEVADEEQEYRALEAYTEIALAAKRHRYLTSHPRFEKVGKLIDAYEAGLPEEYGDLYVEWYDLSTAKEAYDPHEANRLLQDNPDFYQAMLKAGIVKRVDFTKVPSAELWDAYDRYKREPDSLNRQVMAVEIPGLMDLIRRIEPSFNEIDVAKLKKALAKREITTRREHFLNLPSVQYYNSLPVKGYQRDWYLMENSEWRQSAVEEGVIKDRDTTKVPRREVWEKYRQHLTIPDEASKMKHIRENRDLYNWMVQTGKVKALAPAELVEPPPGYAEYIKALEREKELRLSPTGRPLHPLPERVRGIRGIQRGVPTPITGGYMVAAGSSEALRMQYPGLEDYLTTVRGLPRKYHFPEVKGQGILQQEIPAEFLDPWKLWTQAPDESFKRDVEASYPEFKTWITDWLPKRTAATRPRPAPTAYPEFAQPEKLAPTYPPFVAPLPAQYEKLWSEFSKIFDEKQRKEYLSQWPNFRQWINQRWKTNY